MCTYNLCEMEYTPACLTQHIDIIKTVSINLMKPKHSTAKLQSHMPSGMARIHSVSASACIYVDVDVDVCQFGIFKKGCVSAFICPLGSVEISRHRQIVSSFIISIYISIGIVNRFWHFVG